MFKVGDKVMITQKAYINCWASEMDLTVGWVGTIVSLHDSYGYPTCKRNYMCTNVSGNICCASVEVGLNLTFLYPIYVLEKVEEKPTEDFKIGDKVKIVRKVDKPYWVPESMDNAIDEIGVVIEIPIHKESMGVSIPKVSSTILYFPTNALEKFKDDKEFTFGDYVRVTSALNNLHLLFPEMHDLVGSLMQVKYSVDDEVVVFDNGYLWPKECLEKISKDEYLTDLHVRTVKDMVDNITRPNSKTPDASSKSSVEVLSYPYADSNIKKAGWIDPIIQNNHDWVDPTVYKFTVSGVFEFINGDKIIVPSPKGQWKEICSTLYDWPPHYISWAKRHETYSILKIKTFDFESKFYTVNHAEGRIVFDEYLERMKSEPLCVIELTEWQKLA